MSALASMEPRTHARGNGLWGDGSKSVALMLQWSHALTRVETHTLMVRLMRRELLQWSHALTRVETCRQAATVSISACASMEPRTHARGNEHFHAFDYDILAGFNGATHSRAWKRRRSHTS